MSHLWVVEMLNQYSVLWEPTVGVRRTRAGGRIELLEWRTNNPCDRFRLVKYERRSA